MKTRNLFTKVSISIALIALFATCAIWEGRRVRANPMPPTVATQPGFGMVGITRGQTIRVNIVNLSVPSSAQIPPVTCRAVLSFRDDSGRPFTNSDGHAIQSEVSLQSGESAFLDLNGDMFGGPSTVVPYSTDAAVSVGPARQQLRPFVRVLGNPPPGDAPDPCFATSEVIDNTTLQTSFVMPGVAQAGTGFNHNETLVRDQSRK